MPVCLNCNREFGRYELYKHVIKQGEPCMTDLTQVSQAVSELVPDSVAAKAVEAAVATAIDPSPVKIVEDLMLAHSLWAEFKAKLDGLHPSVASIFKALF